MQGIYIEFMECAQKYESFLQSLLENRCIDFLACFEIIADEFPIGWKHVIHLHLFGKFLAFLEIGLFFQRIIHETEHLNVKFLNIFVLFWQLVVLVDVGDVFQKVGHVELIPLFLLYDLLVLVMVNLENPIN